LPKTKAQFKGLQVKLLNMFTMAKSELTTIYQKIVNKIKKIERWLQSEMGLLNPSFRKIIEEIEL
jgi:hypothetical protein